MDEIAWKQITTEEIIRAKSQGVFSDDYDYSGMVTENLGFDIDPKGDLKFDVPDQIPSSFGGYNSKTIWSGTSNYEQYKE
jgi:hypothetical protein